MKKLITLCLLVALSLGACQQPEYTPVVTKESWHKERVSPDGKDSIIYVSYVKPDGQTENFFMPVLLYWMLFRQGGHQAAHQYYRDHPQEFTQQSKYNNYYNKDAGAITKTQTTTKSYSSPSRTTTTTTKSYSSPSRNSYSSPSRSYSSPSRSHSSPSRSYSSPSRGR